MYVRDSESGDMMGIGGLLRVEFLLKTDSGYPNNTVITP